jgi:hypothetical protein
MRVFENGQDGLSRRNPGKLRGKAANVFFDFLRRGGSG